MLSAGVALAVVQTGQIFATKTAEAFAEFDLSHAAGNALAIIEGAGEPIAAGDVGRAMHVTSGSITSVLDTLERRNLVRRYRDPTDRRRVLVDITPEAEELLDQVLPRVQVRARDLVAPLSDEEKRQLSELLQRLGRHGLALEATPDAPGGRRTPDRLRAPRAEDGRRVPPET